MIVDGFPTTRIGLKTLLSRLDNVVVVAEADSCIEALRLIKLVSCDVVIMDLALSDGTGVDALRQMKARDSKVAVLVFTMHTEEEMVVQAVEAGADGYLVKTAHPDEIERALRQLAEGKQYLHGSVVGAVMKNVRLPLPSPPENIFTARQEQVLALAVRGLNNQQIADHLGISISTVKAILRVFYERFEVADRTQLVVYVARDSGLHKRLESLADVLIQEQK
ncbi:MAG: response regulator transcription factor [Candidatus Xenobia bacterium]